MHQGEDLFSAVINENFALIKSLIDNNPELLGAFNDGGETILHVCITQCIRKRNKRMFDYLLSFNWEENAVILTTTLYFAIKCRDRYFFRKLLDKSDSPIGCLGVLHYAVSYANLEACELLIEHGVDIDGILWNLTYEDLSTPLAVAIEFGNTEIVEALLYYGVDIFAHNPYIDYFLISLQVMNDEIQDILVDYCFDHLEPLNIDMLIKMYSFTCSDYIIMRILNSIDTIVYCKKINLWYIEFGYNCLVQMSEPVFKLFFSKFHYFSASHFLHNGWFMEPSINILEYKLKLVLIFDRLAQDYAKTYDGPEPVFPNQIDGLPEDKVLKFGMIVLSHGVQVSTEDFFRVYRQYGTNELFKFMLNLKIKNLTVKYSGRPPYYVYSVVPALMFDPNLTIDSFLSLPQLNRHFSYIECLLDLTALPRFRNKIVRRCNGFGRSNISLDLSQSPDVPSLVEFCRNFIRARIVRNSNVTCNLDFWKILYKLPLPPVLIDVLCFSCNLYNVTRP